MRTEACGRNYKKSSTSKLIQSTYVPPHNAASSALHSNSRGEKLRHLPLSSLLILAFAVLQYESLHLLLLGELRS